MSNQRKKRNTKYNAPKPLPLTAPTQAKASGVAYSASVMILLALSMIFSIALGAAGIVIKENAAKPNWYIYANYLLPQISLFLVAALYFAWLKRPVKQAAKEQKCHPKYFLLAVLLQIGLLSLGTLNDIFLRFLERFGYRPTKLLLPNLDGFGLIGTIFCVAVLPALFEEIFFRGILLKGLRSFGTFGGVLLCGALFSLYHQNPVQTAYQFCCGFCYALLALRAGSVLPTVLAHFLNNAYILILYKCGVQSIPAPVLIPMIIVSGLCLIATLVYLFVFDKKQAEEKDKEEKKKERKNFFLFASVGLAVCAITWITNLFM